VTATTLTRAWQEPAPTRDGLARLAPLDADLWASRLLSDRRRAARHQTDELARITAAVEARARRLGAAALVLTGSTARSRRSAVSDLDLPRSSRPAAPSRSRPAGGCWPTTFSPSPAPSCPPSFAT
jgi:hypothetical protein